MKNIIVKNSDRFKSVLMSVNILLPLKGNDTGKNALLALVLKKSNKMYKTEKELERALAGLYNTTVDVNVEKLDNLYNIQISVEMLSGKYISKDDQEKIKEIIFAIICKPNIEKEIFAKDIFEREKQTLIQRISEERDDKKKYALENLRQDMFKGTDYGSPTLGTIEQVEKITNEELVNHYKYVLKNAQILITAVGNLTGMEKFPQEMYEKLSEYCGKKDIARTEDVENEETHLVEREEKQDINQSVLCIGLKAINVKKEDVYALMLYNAILGGTPASKLFQNVREKESLAYFAKSVYNKLKQVIYMYSGVDPKNNYKAREVMLKQLELIKNGEISNEEFFAAKHSLISAYKELRDSKGSITKHMLNNEIYFGYEVEIEEMIEKIQTLTIEDVVGVSNKIKATNVFLLGGVAHV